MSSDMIKIKRGLDIPLAGAPSGELDTGVTTRAAALLGAETHFVGKVGDDAYGKAALQNLRDRGVIIDNVQTTKTAPTGVAFVAVGAEDETNSIVVVPGANFELTPDDIDAKIFDGAGVLLCQLEIPQATTLRALELAEAAGCVSVLNTAPVPPGGVDDALLRAASIVCPNEVELALLAGANEKATAATVAGAVCAAKDLQRRGAKCVLATLGGNGSLLVEGDLSIHVPVVAGVTPVDTTGAGDSFLGAFAAAKSAGLSTLAAVRAALSWGAPPPGAGSFWAPRGLAARVWVWLFLMH